ncbi:uncharacterized protein RJT20DRAFT_127189 [Scheffersomyces xylosifermentans]|uniref:uncharacterized protein n=1 Tax=Scheffersomyces xylosifermentans TaxID=1304137 RepID=UPI00315D784C
MAYSTGRGGAGNIQTSQTLTSNNNHISPILSQTNSNGLTPASKNTLPTLQVTQSRTQDSGSSTPKDHKKVYYSTGRGGAGNMKSSDEIPSPKLVPQGSNTPQLHTSKVSTGRGGYGNMINNDDPELTRKLQDVDGPSAKADLYAVASNKSFSVGRGGFGNVVSHKSNSSKGSNSEIPNLYAVSSHGEKLKKDAKKKGLFGKIKEIFN